MGAFMAQCAAHFPWLAVGAVEDDREAIKAGRAAVEGLLPRKVSLAAHAPQRRLVRYSLHHVDRKRFLRALPVWL